MPRKLIDHKKQSQLAIVRFLPIGEATRESLYNLWHESLADFPVSTGDHRDDPFSKRRKRIGGLLTV
jgi:hypothetical protein